MFERIKNLIKSLFKKVEKEDEELLPEDMFFQSGFIAQKTSAQVSADPIYVFSSGKSSVINVVNYDFLRRDIKKTNIISMVVGEIGNAQNVAIDNYLGGQVSDEDFEKACDEMDPCYSCDLRARYDKKD